MTRTITTPNGELEVAEKADEPKEYVTNITVSKEIKESDGNYGSTTDFASLTMHLSPALPLADNGPEVLDRFVKAEHLLSRQMGDTVE